MSASAETFRCDEYEASLTRGACALRWSRVNLGAKPERAHARMSRSDAVERFGKCVGCEIGEAHVRGERPVPAVEPPIAARVEKVAPVRAPAVVERTEEAMAEEREKPCIKCGRTFTTSDGRQRQCTGCRAAGPPSSRPEARKAKTRTAAKRTSKPASKPKRNETAATLALVDALTSSYMEIGRASCRERV